MEADIIYAIGDIHGHCDKLRAAHRVIAADAAGRDYLVVHIGDLVDRGPNSRGVIEYLMEGHASGAPWVTLKGNHDRMFVWFMEPTPRRDHMMRSSYEWYQDRLGGIDTLRNYGIEADTLEGWHRLAREAVPAEHIKFLDGLPDRYQTSALFFCHAGVNPTRALEEQIEDDLLWVRKPFHDHKQPYDKLIVHGHTPVKQVTHYGNRINIDTGAGQERALSTVCFVPGQPPSQLAPDGRHLPIAEG